MPQRLEQTQAAIQTQQLSSLQVAVAKLVELPITELATRVRNEMVDNAALEEKDGDEFDVKHDEQHVEERENTEQESEEDIQIDKANTYEEDESYGTEADAMGDYFSADDVPDYLQQRADAQRERNEIQYSSATSFYDELQSQIREHNLNNHETELMEYLIGSLDEDGFLRKNLDVLVDELAIYHNIFTTTSELERLLHVLQCFEPRGIGARSLQECLHIQLTDPDHHTPYTEMALMVVDRYFKDFVNRHWDIIKHRLNVDNQTMDHIRHELTHLNPMPGSALSESAGIGAPTIIPDFFISVTSEGRIDISLNQGDVPELRISRAFRDSIKQYSGNKNKQLSREQKDAYTYARQKVDAAQSFINLLTRRRQTLMAVMRTIVELQKPFFLEDDDESLLRPLTLKEVAERANVDISTVSRVTSSKYVQTLYSTYPLKFFFSSQFTASNGDELSARHIKVALRELINNENKRHPLTDEELAAALKEQGYNVARRTVAKYRDMLGAPTARLRKETY